MDLGLQGRTAIVSAASKGLGKTVAGALAREGVNVVMFSRQSAAIEAAAAEIRGVCWWWVESSSGTAQLNVC